MKKIATLLCLFVVTISTAQQVKPTYEAAGDLVKATYYYKDGSIKEQGFFKDKKLTGKWVSYSIQGKKTMIAYYNKGRKVGKWYAMSGVSIQEISYQNNAIVAVKKINEEAALVLN